MCEKRNLNGNKTEFITFSLKNYKRLNDLVTVTVGSTLVKKSDHCKHLGVTIDKHLGFQTQVEKVLKSMAVGKKTVETFQHRFPSGVLLLLSHALVMSHLDYSQLFFFKINSSLLLSLEKQMNWALKRMPRNRWKKTGRQKFGRKRSKNPAKRSKASKIL